MKYRSHCKTIRVRLHSVVMLAIAIGREVVKGLGV